MVAGFAVARAPLMPAFKPKKRKRVVSCASASVTAAEHKKLAAIIKQTNKKGKGS